MGVGGMGRWLRPVREILERDANAGRVRPFWWRDDDAVRPGPRLSVLFEMATDIHTPIAIAAIPERVTPELLDACVSAKHSVWQHGVAHTNYQTSGKAAELGDARSVSEIVRACVRAREALECTVFEPVMVPPWNRMRADLSPALALAGYTGVSCFGGERLSGPPLTRLDTHVDPVDWRGGRGLVSPDALARQLDKVARQTGPIGLLTHHAVHDEAVTAFVRSLSHLVRDHPGGIWVSPGEALGLGAMQRGFGA